jgi:hypothetical protein
MKNQIYKTKLYIYLFFLMSLLISSYFGEDSSGGAKLDNNITRQYVDAFNVNFNYGIERFISVGVEHSPIFYFLIATLEGYTNSIIVSVLYVLISSFVPIVFYIILKKKFRKTDRKKLFFLSLILFLSPHLRSSASWITTDNLATLFFALSLSKYLSVEKYNKFKDYFVCFAYLIVATYIRQYYAIFFLFYLIQVFKFLDFKKIIILISYSLALSVPFLIYYYLFIQHSYSYSVATSSPLKMNLINNISIFFSLYFFYLAPFYFDKIFKFQLPKIKNLFFYLVSFLLFLSISLYDPVILTSYGGGVFYKISQIINFKYVFYTSSFLGFVIICWNFNKNNLIVYLCILFAFPFEVIYQKYYDLLLILSIIALTKDDNLQNIFVNNNLNLKFIYLYNSIFLIACNYYYN